jgi:hypothetical protein
MSTTQFMNLSLPTPSVTLGPAWATQLNTALTVVDAHDHSDAKGTRVKTAGISINDDLAYNGYGASELKFLQLEEQSGTLSGTLNARKVATFDGNLYWTNGDGTVVQITSGGTLAAVPGSITVLDFNEVTANVTLDSDENVALGRAVQAVISTGVSIEVRLPASATLTAGRIFCIKDASGNSETYPISIVPDGADTIDGSLTFEIDSNFGAAFLVADGVNGWLSV